MYLADQILNAPPLVLAVEMNVYPASFREMVEATLDNLDFQGVGVGARIMDLENLLATIPPADHDLTGGSSG